MGLRVRGRRGGAPGLALVLSEMDGTVWGKRGGGYETRGQARRDLEPTRNGASDLQGAGGGRWHHGGHWHPARLGSSSPRKLTLLRCCRRAQKA